MAKYRKPVDVLLTLGDARNSLGKWPDYSEYEIGAEHIPDLIQMVTDSELHWADSESLEVWAPIHALRALGQLRAEEAIEPLLNLFHELEEDDWVGEELPRVYGMIGAAAIPALAAYLADTSRNISPRIGAAQALFEIAMSHAEAQEACIAAFTHQLEAFRKNDRELNGFLIWYLMNLHAIEAAPLMQRAFAARRVDKMVVGDWEDVQVALGLKPDVERDADFLGIEDIYEPEPFVPQSAEKRKKAKTKRNMARESRKKNRKKKEKRGRDSVIRRMKASNPSMNADKKDGLGLGTGAGWTDC